MEEQTVATGQKNETTARILTLLRLLSSGTGMTREDIFAHPQMRPFYRPAQGSAPPRHASRGAERMFLRDIEFLQEHGCAVQKERDWGGPTRYTLSKAAGPGPLFAWSSAEVDALVLLHNLFADPNTYTRGDGQQPLPVQPPRHPFAEDIEGLLERLVAALPEEQGRYFERWARKPFVYFNLAPMEDYLPHRETIAEIVEAISWRKQIRFDYLPLHREQDMIHHEHVDPYFITFLEGHFYLVAFHHKMNKFLEYRIDRIVGGSIDPHHTLIDAERRRRPIAFSYWISGDIAKRGLSQRWLSQEIAGEETYRDEQGRERRRVLVRASAYSSWRIVKKMLEYGDQAELVEPADLREEIRQVVARMARSYGVSDPLG